MARHKELPIPVFSSLEPVYGDSSQLEEARLRFDRLKARYQQVFSHAPDLFARSPDQRMIKEIAELVMLKHARIERMEVLKKEKNIKAASLGSIGNAHAPLFTALFIFVTVIQGNLI